MADEITRVIFRTYYKQRDLYMDERQVIALFPDEKEHRPGMVMSFMHVGQHGAADIEMVIGQTKPSTPEEYAPVKRELERPPYEYRFKILKRRPH